MSGENLIEVRDVSLRYRVPKPRRNSLRESLFRKLLRRDEIVVVWALKDISFDVGSGESLGLIGDNGAGKSTLCLLLSTIMSPTSDTAKVAGKVSTLLTLGAGFQWDLTGRDKVFLAGIYLMNTIRSLCSKVIWLDRVRIIVLGPAEEVVSKYEYR